MEYIVAAVILIILIMIIVMFIILKKIVRIVNEQSKNYFLTKLQSYDNVILEKESKLKTINEQLLLKEEQNSEEIENTETIDNDYYYSDDIPVYQEENILIQLKKINDNFDFDNEKIIKSFLQIHKPFDDGVYNILVSIKKKLNFDLVYNLQINDVEYQISFLNRLFDSNEFNVLKTYLKENSSFDIIGFHSYIDDQLSLNDPLIYVNVSSMNENYDYLDNRIKTKCDDRIIKGITIIYKNKIYDYALR